MKVSYTEKGYKWDVGTAVEKMGDCYWTRGQPMTQQHQQSYPRLQFSTLLTNQPNISENRYSSNYCIITMNTLKNTNKNEKEKYATVKHN